MLLVETSPKGSSIRSLRIVRRPVDCRSETFKAFIATHL